MPNDTESKTSLTERSELVKPTVIFRAPNIHEEFDYLWSVLLDSSFFKQNGYEFVIPDYPEFQTLVRSQNFDRENREKYLALFQQIYDESYYQKGLIALEKERQIIESIFPRLQDFRRKWGFNILPQYDVVLTRYGPGGRFNPKSGKTIVFVKRDGTFRRTHPYLTVGHEIVEIGLHPVIINSQLTHGEKERLVDHICIKGLGDLLDGYTFQTDDPNLSPIGDKRVDDFFTDTSLEDVPGFLKVYTERVPRA